MLTTTQCANFLSKYNYDSTEAGLKEILRVWSNNKGNLLEKFRKHPNWNEEALAIIFDKEYERGFDSEAIGKFNTWVNHQIDYLQDKNTVKSDIFTQDNIDYLNDLLDKYNIFKILLNKTDIKTNIMTDTNESLGAIIKLRYDNFMHDYNEFEKKYEATNICSGKFIDRELLTKFRAVKRALRYIYSNATNNIVTKELAEGINDYINVKAVEGQKLSRVINKICKTINLDQIKDIRNNRDYGYNREFAIMSDSINPIKYKRITVISLNPLDYWGMSFGHKWASCHSIDKDEVRGYSGFHGEWSSGTESYMLDSTSVIYYTIDQDYKGNLYYDQDKMNRCVFCIRQDGKVLIQSRVYPDGRDGGDNSLPKQFREVMQKVISETFELNNFWNPSKKGKNEVRPWQASCGTHYKDYIVYDDGVVSINKDNTSNEKIEIGHDPICPICGEEHSCEEWITCDGCRDKREIRCEHCGERIRNLDDAIYIDDVGYFCDDECANREGYYYCDDIYDYEHEDNLTYCNDGEYHLSENCFYDNYSHEDVYGDPEVETEDGNFYESEYNAKQDGYRQDYFTNNWYEEDDLYYDEYYDEYFNITNGGIEINDKWYIDKDSAEDAGYVQLDNGEWVEESEVSA